MVCYSDDSSESERILLEKKKKELSPASLGDSNEVSTAHGIVVTHKSPGKKSPSKQMKNRDDSYRLENLRVEYSSDNEQVDEFNTTNIKVEQFSSEDESDPIFHSPNASRARKHLFDDNEDEEATSHNRNQSTIRYDVNESGNSMSQDAEKQPVKRRRILIKKEPISSEDEEPRSHEDPEKSISRGELTPRKHLTRIKNHERGTTGDNSDGEIPPSQFWLHQYKEMEKNIEKKPVKMTEESSPIKSSDSVESFGSRKRRSLSSRIIVDSEASQRKSPLRITKRKIMNTKYEIMDEHDEDESFPEKVRDVEKKEENEFIGSRESGDEKNSDEPVLRKEEKPQDQVSARKLSPVKKRQSPKKVNASPKQKSTSEPEALNNSSTEAKRNTNKTNSPKRNLAKELNSKPLKSNLDICDDDTCSEETEEHIKKDKTPKKYVLALQKPSSSTKKPSSPNGSQMVLVRKTNLEMPQNVESNSLGKRQLSPPKVSSSVIFHNDVNDKDLFEDSSGDAAPRQTVVKSASPKKKKRDISSSDDEKPSVKKAEISQTRKTIKCLKSTGSMPTVPLKRKSDSEDSLGNEEASSPSIIPKTPLRTEHPESDSSKQKSNKRAKLMPAAKKPACAMPDLDKADTLTELNTTLNKSMAFMENMTETVKSTKSRKSVSINTKQNLTHPPNNAKARRSILKKPQPIATNDGSEGVESSPEQSTQQNVQENVQPIVALPKIVGRPLNLHNLKDQESLAHDSTKASFGLDDISDNDEIYILEVPRTVNPKKLKGQTIRLGGKNKLQIEDESYETCDKDATNISCVFRTDREHNSYKTVNLRPARCISVRQRLSKNLNVKLSHQERRTVPFPENLKIRHPLFGAEYEDKIIIPDKKVSKRFSSAVTKSKLITKTNKISTAEKSPKKLKNLKKRENKAEWTMDEKNSGDKAISSVTHDNTDSTSSDLDSNASFFQKVKHNNIVKKEKRNKSKSSLNILNLDKIPSNTDSSVHLEEAITAVKKKDSSASKKIRLSLNSSLHKMNSFDANANSSQFFSSTPIKIGNDRHEGKGEILANKIKKRKTHVDVKGITSPKNVKTN